MMNLDVIYEDEDILVLDKPSGIVVNNSDTAADSDTIQKLVSDRVNHTSSDEEFILRGGVVHRLDRETSGILLIAKNAKAFKNLQSQFKERKVSKEYIALSHGDVIPDKGEIDVPVGRLPWNRRKFGVLAGGRQSLTSYEVIEKADAGEEVLSLLKLNPKTGRTHQIRVHLKHIGRPIFSDFLYSGRKVSREDRKILPRVFLHASRITFLHPRTGEEMIFFAKLPTQLKETLKMLKFNYGGDLNG